VGDFDFVKAEAEGLGVETLFWRIAMKPGKPNYFGARGDKLLFGLPGNPVSVLVSFHQLVRPALARLAGVMEPERLVIEARLETELAKRTPRLEYVRGRLGRDAAGAWTVRPCTGQDSHMLGGLARADALILMPLERSRLPAGATVAVEPLFWGAM
jgi:molybdopterin molybdotransferase